MPLVFRVMPRMPGNHGSDAGCEFGVSKEILVWHLLVCKHVSHLFLKCPGPAQVDRGVLTVESLPCTLVGIQLRRMDMRPFRCSGTAMGAPACTLFFLKWALRTSMLRVGSYATLGLTVCVIRVKYAEVTYIRELGGPFWAGRVLGGREGLDYPPTTPPHPQGPQTLTNAKIEESWVAKCAAAFSRGLSKACRRSCRTCRGDLPGYFLTFSKKPFFMIRAGVYTAMAGALEQVATSLVPHSTGQAQEVGEGVRSAARSAAKQLANSLSSGSAAASPSRIPATHVEYIGWCHALTQLVAVAVVEVHAPNLGAQPSSGALAFLDCPPAQHFPTSLHAQTAGTQGSSPPEGPLQMPKGSRLMKTGYDFRRTPKASRMLGAKEETCDGRSDVGFHVQPLMSRCRGKLVSAHLLDSAPAMMGALASGVDAACMLLRVDALVAER
eukprot:1150581-Pelagomonas_calceolata.AAC.2